MQLVSRIPNVGFGPDPVVAAPTIVNNVVTQVLPYIPPVEKHWVPTLVPRSSVKHLYEEDHDLINSTEIEMVSPDWGIDPVELMIQFEEAKEMVTKNER